MSAKKWLPYHGDRYLNLEEIYAWLKDAAKQFPSWVVKTSIGKSRNAYDIPMLTLGKNDGHQDNRPGLWLDGGTHAAEWTGIMACIYAVSKWLERIETDDKAFTDWLSENTLYVVPCVSPDGFKAMFEGAPYLRSSLRPPAPGRIRIGLDPQDMDGDGEVRWMRWKHPAGAYVCDETIPGFMRPRTFKDRPEDAYMFCSEGMFLEWDGVEWKQAPREFGLDLNRNFPSHWAPFAMFGMDGGTFSLSEPESRALIDAFTQRPFISAALTNHTYTGAILTQPSRDNSPLDTQDILLMERMANQVVSGTAYRVYRIFPDFAYDKKKAVVGLWSDTMTTTLGVPAYTLELWDPFAYCGLQNDDPIGFFINPDHEKVKQLVAEMSARTQVLSPWHKVEHPQLGIVEVGGLNYMKTVRNPPNSALPAECEQGFTVADQLRLALPHVEIETEVIPKSDSFIIRFSVQNTGYLSTSGLKIAETLPGTPFMSVSLTLTEGVHTLIGPANQSLEHLDGWALQSSGGANSIYPSLPPRSQRRQVEFEVQGSGSVELNYTLGRAGRGRIPVEIG